MISELALQLTEDLGYFKRYESTSGDSLLFYQKEGCYELGIADYHIPHDFQLAFHNPSRLFRFGVVYEGVTSFQLSGSSPSSFSPSSFFVEEEDIQGVQCWKKGQHFRGIEVTVYADYLDRLYTEFMGQPLDDSILNVNCTYPYLPIQILSCLQQLFSLSGTNDLNKIYLESKILECLAILHNEFFQKDGQVFFNQSVHGKINVGDRTIHLNAADIHSIEKAFQILSEDIKNPPTIERLSQMVLLNPQKLKAGFLHHYHMTIGDYLISLRMAFAASLLCTTNDSVQMIAEQVGYTGAASFIKMFKKYYQKTPLQYRFENR